MNRKVSLTILIALSATTLSLTALAFAQEQNETAAAQEEAAHYVAPTFTEPTAVSFKKVVFIGDSYTAGAGSTSTNNTFVHLVAARENWLVTNYAYGGTGYLTAATDGLRACGIAICPSYPSVIPQAAASKPDVVFVSGGRNDIGQYSNTTLRAGIVSFFQKLREKLPKATIYASSPIWQNTEPPTQLRLEQTYVASACRAIKCTYLDIGEPLGGHADYVIADHVHPNDAGHQAIAVAIEKALSR